MKKDISIVLLVNIYRFNIDNRPVYVYFDSIDDETGYDVFVKYQSQSYSMGKWNSSDFGQFGVPVLSIAKNVLKRAIEVNYNEMFKDFQS